jgi:hypothetical protein
MAQVDSTPNTLKKTVFTGFAGKMGGLFLILLCCFFEQANATHFRYGTVAWDRSNGSNTVTFTLNQVWRTSFGWGTTITPGAVVQPGSFCFGDGQCANLSLTVTSVNTTEDWFSGTATITHTYASAGTYTASFANCCRLSSLQNNFDENYRTEAQVVLNGTDNASPVSTLPPIVYLPPAVANATFQIPALDPDGDPYTYSLSTSTQQGGSALSQPSGFSVSASGLATFNTIGKVVGQLYNASVRVTDSHGAATTVDFIMQIANQANPPYFDYTNLPPVQTPANNTTYYIQPGQLLTFNVTGRDNDPLDVVTVLSSSLPSGSVLSAQVGNNPAQRVFTWTPTAAQLGTYILSFDLVDGQGTHAITPTYVNIVVSTNPEFISPPTPLPGSSECVQTGIKYTATIQAHSPDTALNVTIAGTVLPATASFSPNPTAPGNTSTGTLNWNPTGVNWGANDITFVVTDDLGNSTSLTYTVIVNNPPSFTTTQGDVTITVGQTFTYVVAATDPDLAFGDVLEIHDVTLPAWLTYTDNGDGTYTLSGTPTAADLGMHQVFLEAEDSFHHCYAPTEQIFNITVEENPITVDVQAVSTCANVNNGAVSVAVDGGTAPYGYRWSSSGVGATDVSAQTGSSITGLAPGTYSVTITDDAGIQATASAIITNTLNSLTISPDVTICPGGSATLTAGGADIYSWNTGETTASITVTPAATTTYTVTGYVNSGNLVTNGDFETGNVAFSSAYNYVSPSDNAATPLSGTSHTGLVPESTYAVDVNANTYHPAFAGLDHTNGSGNFMIINGSGTPNTEVWSQTVDNIIPNTTYYFSTWVTSVNPGSPAELNFSINGQPLGSTFNAPAGVTGTWVQFYQTWNSGASTSADIAIVNQNVTLGGNDFGLDDVSFTTVCPDTRTVTVTVSPAAAADAGPDQFICPGATATLTAADAGAGATYLWSTGDTTLTINVNPAVTTTYTLTVTAPGGCVATGDVNITVGDNVPPVAVCRNRILYLDATGNATLNAQQLDNGSIDKCGALAYGASVTSFTCANAGANPVIFTVTDLGGNTDTCNAFVYVIDTVAPVAICHDITVQLDADGQAVISPEDVDNGSNDACGLRTMSVSPNAFNCFNIGANTVTLTVTDIYGNVNSCTSTVTIRDTVAPTANCKSITVQLDASGTATITAADIDDESSDPCNLLSVTASKTNFTCADLGQNLVTLTVTDRNGNVSTCTATVTVEDNVAPEARCQNVTVSLDANGLASVTAAQVDNGSSDNCGIALLDVSPSAFNCSNIGANTVTLSVTDNNGNTSTCNAIVTVVDSAAPVAVCKNITVQLDANGTAVITAADIDGGSNDGCGNVTLSTSQTQFDCSNVGDNRVTLTVTDANGNTASCTATVTVADSTAPVLAPCPADVTLTALTNNCFQNFGWAKPLYSENCGGATLTATASDPTVIIFDFGGTYFASFPVGTTTVTQTVTDAHGNSDVCDFTVTVVDRQNPIITGCPADITVNASATQCSAQAFWNQPTASDNCPGVSLTGSSVSGDVFPLGTTTVTYIATDAHGNSVNCSFTVTVRDASGPQAICKPATVNLDANGHATITAAQVDNGSYDNCTAVTLSVSPSAFTCANIGANTVTLTATDANGNSSSCTTTVTVRDVTPPVAICQNVTVTLNGNGTGTVTAAQLNNGSYDNCGPVTLSAPHCNFTCANAGPNNVTLTVTDASGNTSTCTAVVTVVGGANTTVSCKNITVALNAQGNVSINAAQVSNGAQGACGSPVTLSVTPHYFTCANVGANAVTLTATDANGNTATCTATVTVVDNTPPVAICRNKTVALVNGTATITAADINNGSYDNCAVTSVTISKSTFNCSNVGANQVTLTVKDAAGNTSTCTATVTVTGSGLSCSVVSVPTSSCSGTGGNPNNIYLGYGPQTTHLQVSVSGGGGPYTYSWTPSNRLSCSNCANPLFTPNAQSNYTFTVTVTNANGCSTTCNITICVLDIRVPVAGGCGNDDDRRSGSDKVYVCHIPPGNHNNPQTISISVNAVPAHVPLHGGDHLGRCDQQCGSNKMEDDDVAELVEGDNFDMLLYPNPFHDQFHLRIESESEEKLEIRMFTATGQLISEQKDVAPNDDLLFGFNLAAGIYFVEVKQGDHKKVVRVSKAN